MKVKKVRQGMKLHHRIFIGLFLGIFVGIGLSFMGGIENEFINSKIMPLLQFMGDIFLRLIRMVVVPLVFFSIIDGVVNLGDVKKLKSIGVKTVFLFLGSALCAVSIGLIVANIMKPGLGVNLGVMSESVEIKELPGVYDVILDLFPINPIKSMAEGTMMHIISFAIFVGSGMLIVGERSNPLKTIVSNLSEVMFKIVDMILNIIPFGVFGLMSVATARFGVAIFGPILKFVIADYTASIIHTIVIYSLMLILFAKVNPITFWKKAIDPWLIAFSTCTSAAALPVSMKIAGPKLGIPKETANFVLPLGATANMNGTCIYFGIIVLFAAQLYGISLSVQQQILLALQATLLSVGCAAMPQVGLLISITLLTTMGLPLEATALVAGIYRIIDQIHTATNASGDLVVALSVAGLEGNLDRDIFNYIEVK